MESASCLVPGWSFWVGSILGGACREPNRVVGVDLVLEQPGSGFYAEVGHSLYPLSPMVKVSPSMLSYLGLKEG